MNQDAFSALRPVPGCFSDELHDYRCQILYIALEGAQFAGKGKRRVRVLMHSQYDTFRPGSVMAGSIARFGLVGNAGRSVS